MKNWHEHWATFPLNFNETDFFRQVGKTINQKRISPQQFKVIVDSVIVNLDVNPKDDLLDLCCGNGLITKAVSEYCNSMAGIDYSTVLIEIAKKHNGSHNIEYCVGDVTYIENFFRDQKFTKAYMYEALQHFAPESLYRFLTCLMLRLTGDFKLFFASVPDRKKKYIFYNTPKRKAAYFWKSLLGREAIGYWWDFDEIAEIGRKLGLKSKLIKQNRMLHTAHYRFDFMLYQQSRAQH